MLVNILTSDITQVEFNPSDPMGNSSDVPGILTTGFRHAVPDVGFFRILQDRDLSGIQNRLSESSG